MTAIARHFLPTLAAAPPTADHTFDTFVVGEANEAAYVATRAITDGTARAPLFVLGPSGVGKTHLLHATFHALDGAGLAVLCVAAARLLTALVSAYESGAADDFWSGLTTYAALLLDDAHSIGARDELEGRLLDGLAGWVAAGRLVILTCDREPTFVTRLRDRFADSALTAIAPPEPALRLAILRDKARRHGIELDAHLARRLANDFGGNVRRLEGALTRLVAHARLCGARVDEALAVAVFPELAAPAPAPLTVDDVIVATARAFGTSVRRLRGRDRRHAVRLPRQVAMHLGRKIVGSSYGALGEAFGRDHTTVLQACRSVATRLETDRSLAATVARIEQRLATGTR